MKRRNIRGILQGQRDQSTKTLRIEDFAIRALSRSHNITSEAVVEAVVQARKRPTIDADISRPEVSCLLLSNLVERRNSHARGGACKLIRAVALRILGKHVFLQALPTLWFLRKLSMMHIYIPVSSELFLRGGNIELPFLENPTISSKPVNSAPRRPSAANLCWMPAQMYRVAR